VNLSRTTKIQVYPLDEGRSVMKSMESEVQGRSGISSGFRNPQGLCLESFERQPISQD